MSAQGPSGGWRLWAQAGVVLAVVTCGSFLLFHAFIGTRVEDPAPSPAPVIAGAGGLAPATPEPKDEAVILALTGPVERAGEDGAWRPASSGDHLRAEDTVRTGAGGQAELQVGAHARLTVTDGTELKVREVTRAVHRFRLTRGRVAVDYAAHGERVLRIEGGDGDAVAQAKDARFSVLASGENLAVATERGAVDLRAQDATVAVTEGMTSVAAAGRAPSVPVKLPAELLLKVARAAKGPEAACAVVEGTADVGSEVRVDGALAPLDDRGAFHVEVPRRPGLEKVLVVTRDALGRKREELIACRTPRRAAPIDDVAIDWNGKE